MVTEAVRGSAVWTVAQTNLVAAVEVQVDHEEHRLQERTAPPPRPVLAVLVNRGVWRHAGYARISCLVTDERANEAERDPASEVDGTPAPRQPNLYESRSAEPDPQESIVPEVQQRISPEIVGAYVAEQYSGPIPHPHILRQIDEIAPGAARQIIDAAHGQTTHRQDMERKYLDAGIANSKRGQWFGFIVAMTVVIGSMLLIALGYSVWGFSLALFGLAALVGVFVYTQRRESHELREASQAFPREIGGTPDQQPRNEDGP